MSSSNNFLNSSAARKLVQKLYPAAQNIHLIEHGSENIVVLVDEEYVIRCPQDKSAFARSQYENHILLRFAGLDSFNVPLLLVENDAPPYMITSFVPGVHLSADKVNKLPKEKQLDFAKSLARFAYYMHSSFDLNEEFSVRADLELDKAGNTKPWSASFRDNVFNFSLPDKKLDEIAKNWYDKWLQTCDKKPTVVVHNDLLQDNMMFDNKHELTGIVDFGDVSVGVPEQEFQQLYRVSEELVVVAAEEYRRLSNQSIDVEAIKTWAIMRELSDYCKRLATDKTDHYKFRNSCKYLNKWLPQADWGKTS